MARYRITFAFWMWLSIFVVKCHGNCDPSEEGQGFSINCDHWFLGSSEVLFLKAENAGHNGTVAKCSTVGCSETYPMYTSSSAVQHGMRLNATFQIFTLSRTLPFNMETKWECGFGNRMSVVCDRLLVYARPARPVCDLPRYTGANNNEILLKCKTDRVYPRARCTFGAIIQDPSTASIIVFPERYIHNTVARNPVYYSTECFVQFPVRALLRNPKAFVVKMSPTLPGTKIYGQRIEPIPLAKPTTGLSPDCPRGVVKNGLIKSGTRATCRCVMTTIGYPTGQAQWYTWAGVAVGVPNLIDGSAILKIHDSSVPLKCIGISSSGTSLPFVFIPKFANAVDRKSVTLRRAESTGRCFTDGDLISVHCEVPETAVQPYPVFKMQLNSQAFTTFQNGSLESGIYRYRFMFKPVMPGNFTVTCTVGNGYFTDLATKVRLKIAVKDAGPIYPFPFLQNLTHSLLSHGQHDQSTPPLLRIEETVFASLTCSIHDAGDTRDDAELTCQSVQDLVPVNDADPVCELKIIPAEWKSIQETIITSELRDSRACNSVNPTERCGKIAADAHLITIYLQVAYEPFVRHFSVNGNQSVVTEPGSNITFKCQVESVPPATVLLEGNGYGQLGTFRSKSHNLLYRLTDLSCGDSGRYKCKADNELGFITHTSQSSAFVDVHVPCELKMLHPHEKPQTVLLSSNGTTVVNFEIYGYPQPAEFLLKAVEGSTFREVNRSLYSVSYTRFEPSLGRVTVNLGPGLEKSSRHVLIVANDVGDDLNIEFSVEPASTDDDPSMTNDLVIGLSVGGAVIGLLLIIVFTVWAFWRRHGKRDKTAKGKRDDISGQALKRRNNTYENSLDGPYHLPRGKDLDLGCLDPTSLSKHLSSSETNEHIYDEPEGLYSNVLDLESPSHSAAKCSPSPRQNLTTEGRNRPRRCVPYENYMFVTQDQPK